jgi:hypothetical protein
MKEPGAGKGRTRFKPTAFEMGNGHVRTAKAVICEMECHTREPPLSSLTATPR